MPDNGGMSGVIKTGGKRSVGDGTPGPGRPPGSQNKTTIAAKQAFQEAFDGLGGVDALVKWGKKNDTEFYRLYSRLIPLDMKHSGSIGTFDASKYTSNELDHLERALLPLATASDDAEGGEGGEGPSRR